ncbi:cupin domain-containing protein [Streptomyces sp. NPDC002138]|uniref:cupin domain-containing protein n=1 Tax=Streptomyces sp. NPDC002138 TaxID=3154410 RepID=UPI0033265356
MGRVGATRESRPPTRTPITRWTPCRGPPSPQPSTRASHTTAASFRTATRGLSLIDHLIAAIDADPTCRSCGQKARGSTYCGFHVPPRRRWRPVPQGVPGGGEQRARRQRDHHCLDANHQAVLPIGPDPLSKKQNSDQAHPGHILELFDAGATIVLQTLQDYWPPLTRFCRSLEFALTHPVQANAYITPRSAQGLAVHTDDHDVFVLQTFGRKNWKVYGQPSSSDEGGDPGEPLIDVELKPGDMLYIPRGFAHSARTADVPSAHITIGIRAYQWRIVFEKALTEILDTLREPLPVGFADDPAELAAQAVQQLGDLKRRLDSIDLDSLSAAVTRHFWARRSPVLTGQLQQLIDLDDISDGSTLRRRPQSVCNLRLEEDRLRALLGDRELTMPARLEPALRRVLDGEPFQVSDLAEYLDGPGRLVFAQRLVREGLLENAS